MQGSVCLRNRHNRNGQVSHRDRRILRASLTVECAAVLPLFFCAVLTFMTFMDAVRVQTRENLALSNKARLMAVTASVAGEKADGKWIDLAKTKSFAWPFPDLMVPKLKVALRARVYPWIGSEEGIGEAPGEGGGKQQVIYLTNNQEVYHTHADCTHLDLSIIKTDLTGVKSMRNVYGKKYKKCKDFPPDYKGPVYVTAKGEYYYPSLQYGSLTRYVHAVRSTEAGDLKLCERCAARDRKEEAHAA